MTTYGDNWIVMNAKKKILHEKYLRENKENHDKIVNDIATHIGTRFPHIADEKRGGYPKHAYDKKASIEDNIRILNNYAPPGGYTNHDHALTSIKDHISENPSVRTHIEDKAILNGADPDTVMDDAHEGLLDDVIGDISGAVNPPKK